MPQVREVEGSNSKDRLNLTQCYKTFRTSTSTYQVAALPWRYDMEMGAVSSLGALHERYRQSGRGGLSSACILRTRRDLQMRTSALFI